MLLDRVAQLEKLRDAWQQIARERGEDSTRSRSIEKFAADPDTKLLRLSDELTSGNYHPRPLTQVMIPKSDGGVRELRVPHVRDRIVERSLLEEVMAFVDPSLGPWSFAYRPGLGVRDAVQAVVALREEGLEWVLRTDVDECFPSVPREFAKELLFCLLPDDSVQQLVVALLDRPLRGRQGTVDVAGLAQGTSLAPLLMNLVLAEFDAQVAAEGHAMVRYADDIVICCGSRDEAVSALKRCQQILEGIGMGLGSDKTEIMSFQEGFAFLGEDFGPRYPPALDQGLRVPDDKTLFVGRPGSRIVMRKGQVMVRDKTDTTVLQMPAGHVARVVCFGSVGFSSGARAWAFSQDKEVIFASARGSFQGSFVPGRSTKYPRRLREQLRCIDDEDRCVDLGRALVRSKIRHQVTLVRRLGRRQHASILATPVKQMLAAIDLLGEATSGAEIMGLEGVAARSYFPCLGELVPDDLAFELRSRRPPRDVVNSALGYAYAVLLGEATLAAHAAGLDPAFGILHREQDDRPSLALDLMEEFRPLVVDQVVMNLARRRWLTPTHGRSDGHSGGVLLTKAGKGILVDAYETRMLTVTSGASPGVRASWRRLLYRQAAQLRRVIQDPGESWRGLSWR